MNIVRVRATTPLQAFGADRHRALLDFGDVIVHVFHHPAREHYDLEGLWIDAPRVAIEVPTDARVAADDYA